MSDEIKGQAKEQEENIQWHPAFLSSMEIELAEYEDHLQFISEHELSKKPLRIDVLIIKKQDDTEIKKNIGRLFKEHNIVEYKSPEDYLSIDDFYKVCAYAFLYKASGSKTDEIKINQITISCVSGRYPRKLIKHLKENWAYGVEKKDEGIYYINGSLIPMQILVTKEMSPEKNMWLNALTYELNSMSTAENILRHYQEHRKEAKYQAYLDALLKANPEIFVEVMKVSTKLEEGLMEVIKVKGFDKIFEQEGIEKGIEKGKIIGIIETMLELKCSMSSIENKLIVDYKMDEIEAKKLITDIQNQINRAS